MAMLNDVLKTVGYTGHLLECYLVWRLFSLLAGGATIFKERQFKDCVVTRTDENGSDLVHYLITLLYELNTPEAQCMKLCQI